MNYTLLKDYMIDISNNNNNESNNNDNIATTTCTYENSQLNLQNKQQQRPQSMPGKSTRTHIDGSGV
eukprot:Pgem_evm1s3366